MLNGNTKIMCMFQCLVVVLRPVQTLATTPNIVGPTLLSLVARFVQTLATSHNLLGLYMRIQRTLGHKYPQFHTYLTVHSRQVLNHG